ncbi:MAG: RluA family pseudouridine synthase [Bauldia sp.]|nr:RluA family pseudouridine synthase [Bauldia sp.]
MACRVSAAPDRLELPVAIGEAGTRLDAFLAAAAPTLSRSRAKALILAGAVSVDGIAATEPKRAVTAGEVVTVDVPPPEPATPRGEAIALAIVHEDADLVVIDKPAGLVVHPAPGHSGGTLVNALIAHCGDSLSGIGGVRRPGIVHRLDKDTSGLLVVAKNDRAHQGLAAQFADHGREGPLERGYKALVWGAPDRREGVIDAAIDRSAKNRQKMAIAREGGREAITHYAVEAVHPRRGDVLAAMMDLRLETGRTHQIRVHLAALGHPVIGDPVYGAGFATKAEKLPEPARTLAKSLGRQALHAWLLGFEHPVTGETLRFTSPLPPDMAALAEALGFIQDAA